MSSSLIRFDLRAAHLGDFLLALPAMRPGDKVVLPAAHRLPGLALTWADSGAGLRPKPRPGQHMTEAWLAATGRAARRWHLLPPAPKCLIVIAPTVAAPGRRWHGWDDLRRRLPGATWIDGTAPRGAWMDTLNRAAAVICPDTGTAHMADALGCPRVIALYGRLFDSHAPFWNRSFCIAKRSMFDISTKDILERLHG